MWHGGDWENPNSQFFGEYTHKYKIQAAVPQLVINENNIKSGRIDVPTGEKDIKIKESNPCLLLNKSVSFKNLDLNKLSARPKIWANERILISLGNNSWLFQWNGKAISKEIIGDEDIDNQLAKELLFTKNISKIIENREFEIAEPQKVEFSGIAFSSSDFIPYLDFENAIKIKPVKSEISNTADFSKETISDQLIEEEIELPFIGKIKTQRFSLPIITAILAATDGLTNPCGFFVLFFLLAALISLSGARKKMFLVGGIFVFFFALYYFLFMAVLLNIFMMGKEIAVLTTIAGIICIFAGLLNVKDYFFFQKGASFSLSKDKKLKFEQRVRNLSLAKSTFSLIIGTTIVASTISLIAIACTFGIPLAYTKILSLNSLSPFQYYLYLVFYNLIYIIPMAVIVSVFAVTLGKKRFGKEWIKRLKLISGFIILFLGLILIYNYVLLENVGFLFWVIISAVIVSGLIILISQFYKSQTNKNKNFYGENRKNRAGT